jgi:DNA-binding MurR/RpiR family transcriptional regulator
MDRYKKIKDKIKGKYELLPRNHKKVADYFLDNFDRIPFLNVQDISRNTGISGASIVRFARRVGFDGFSELRDAIAEIFQNQMNSDGFFTLFDKHKAEEDLLTEVANLDIQNINNTLNMVERKTFDKIISSMSNANRVFTAGLGISYLLAEILAYQLTQVGIDSSVLKHTHTTFHEQVLFMNKKDILIVLSFPPYSKETIELAKYANQKDIETFAITNRPASPVTFHTKANLIVKSENMLYTNSFAAISVLINAIATACALKKKLRAKEILEESEKIMINQNQIISED